MEKSCPRLKCHPPTQFTLSDPIIYTFLTKRGEQFTCDERKSWLGFCDGKVDLLRRSQNP